jgi:hypothetical protein
MPKRFSIFPWIIIAPISDLRLQSRISAVVVVKSAVAMFLARMGSLNALELTAGALFWKSWLGQSPCSADTVGRVHALMDADQLRHGIHHMYDRLKRNKACRIRTEWGVAVVDGHESHASYFRHCSACLQRTIHFESGDRIQFYHRQVTLMLLCPVPRQAASRFVCCWIMSRNEPGRMKSLQRNAY